MKDLKKIASIASLLTLCLIMLGAYTRLSDSGLGCPDWPGCYGNAVMPSDPSTIESIEQLYNVKVEPRKAWIEMAHRYVAGSLGILIFILSWFSFKLRHNENASCWYICVALIFMLFFQALLGKYTVTMRLYPIVVMGHLIGGMVILCLLWLLNLKLNFQLPRLNNATDNFKTLSMFGFIVLSLQIMLGGWTSANYAAVVCLDFPTCQGSLFPELDLSSAFNFLQVGIFDSPGEPLNNTARVTIQFMHRLGALVTFIVISIISSKYISHHQPTAIRNIGKLLLISLLAQVSLGITNVLALLPMPVAVLHNGMAAIMLILLLTINVINFSSHSKLVFKHAF